MNYPCGLNGPNDILEHHAVWHKAWHSRWKIQILTLALTQTTFTRLNESFKPHDAVVSPSVKSVYQNVLPSHNTGCWEETRNGATNAAYSAHCKVHALCKIMALMYNCRVKTPAQLFCFSQTETPTFLIWCNAFEILNFTTQILRSLSLCPIFLTCCKHLESKNPL